MKNKQIEIKGNVNLNDDDAEYFIEHKPISIKEYNFLIKKIDKALFFTKLTYIFIAIAYLVLILDLL